MAADPRGALQPPEGDGGVAQRHGADGEHQQRDECTGVAGSGCCHRRPSGFRCEDGAGIGSVCNLLDRGRCHCTVLVGLSAGYDGVHGDVHGVDGESGIRAHVLRDAALYGGGHGHRRLRPFDANVEVRPATVTGDAHSGTRQFATGQLVQARGVRTNAVGQLGGMRGDALSDPSGSRA